MDTNDLVKLLPSGYEQACFDKKAITRKRTIKNPLDLLRLILFYTTLQLLHYFTRLRNKALSPKQ